MRTHVFETDQLVPAPLAATFAFFARAENLERITPAFLHFRILTPTPIVMSEGTRIAYRLRLFGLPVRWLSRIEAWRPGASFVDRQLEGPYARWVHTHTFEAEGGATRVRDRVEYALPLDPLSRPAHPLFVRPTIERIFRHRRRAIAALAPAMRAEAREAAPGAVEEAVRLR